MRGATSPLLGLNSNSTSSAASAFHTTLAGSRLRALAGLPQGLSPKKDLWSFDSEPAQIKQNPMSLVVLLCYVGRNDASHRPATRPATRPHPRTLQSLPPPPPPVSPGAAASLMSFKGGTVCGNNWLSGIPSRCAQPRQRPGWRMWSLMARFHPGPSHVLLAKAFMTRLTWTMNQHMSHLLLHLLNHRS